MQSQSSEAILWSLQSDFKVYMEKSETQNIQYNIEEIKINK